MMIISKEIDGLSNFLDVGSLFMFGPEWYSRTPHSERRIESLRPWFFHGK